MMEDEYAGLATPPTLTPSILTGRGRQTQASKKVIERLFKNIFVQNPNGKVTKKDSNLMMNTCFPGQQIDELDTHIFRVYDLNQDGVIYIDEALAAIAIIGSGTVEEKLTQIFHIYDINNDGAICKDEWTGIFRILSNW